MYLENEPVGYAAVRREGLYRHICCRCRIGGEGFFRLRMSDGTQEQDLGILVPEGDCFAVDTRVKGNSGDLSFRIVKPGREKLFIPVVEGGEFLHLDKLRRAEFEKRNGVCGVVIPADP